MKVTKILAAFPFMALSLLAATPTVMPETFFPTLDGILKHAVQQSPRMLNRTLDLEIAENDRIQARAGLLPNLGGYGNYYQTRDTRADLPGRLAVTKVSYNFSVNQPLFYWGERVNGAKMGDIRSNMAKGQYRDGYRQLAQTLRSDYMRLIVQKVAVQRVIFNLEYAKSQLAQEEERLAKKVISDAQIFGVRLNAEQAQIACERAQYDFETMKASFARLSGAALPDEAIPDAIPVLTYDAPALDRLLAGFLGQKDYPTTEAYVMRQQLEIERLSYATSKTRLLPKLGAVLGVSQDEQSYTINIAQRYKVNSIFGGISVNWNIFDGFAAGANERNALARRRQVENDYRSLTDTLAQQAQTQVKQINFTARSMSIADRQLIASESTLKSRQDEFSRGVIAESDVSVTRLMLYDSIINAYNYRIEYLTRMGDFLGTIVEDPVVANIVDTK